MDKYDFDSNVLPEGTILTTTVGYNVTIPRFYKYLGSKGKCSMFVRRVEVKNVTGGGWQGECVPTDTFYDNKIVVARIGKNGYLKIDGLLASRWDGKPAFYDYMD